MPRLARALTMPVTTEDIQLRGRECRSGRQKVRARLYLPQGMPDAPALVIFHGVHHLGIDEPRLVGFANGDGELRHPGADAGVAGHQGLPREPGLGADDRRIGKVVMRHDTGGPVGVMGLSFAGGLALVAAENPAYAPNFKFVFAVGAQDSMARVTEYYLTGRDVRPDGTTEVLPPHNYGPLVIEYEYLESFLPAADLEPVRAVLRAHLYEDQKGEARAMLLLNDTQKREAEDLENATLPATRAKIAAAIAAHAYEFPELSPEGGLGTMTTPVYLLHGEADNIIPAAETLWMARELPRKT